MNFEEAPHKWNHGGLSFWRGRPWWFLYPQDWRAALPEEWSALLKKGEPVAPQTLAAVIGADHYFPLTEGRLGRWKLDLKKLKLPANLLPNIEQRKAWKEAFPLSVVPELRTLCHRVWSELVPLLGPRRSLSCLETMVLPYAEWKSVKTWQLRRLQEFRTLYDEAGTLSVDWNAASWGEKCTLFTDFLGPGLMTVERLRQIIQARHLQSPLELFRLWCGPFKEPNEKELFDWLALGLAYPDTAFTTPTLLRSNRRDLITHRAQITPEKLRFVQRNGAHFRLDIARLGEVDLKVEDLQFSHDHDLYWRLQDRSAATRYFQICRRLQEAGFPLTLARDAPFMHRTGNRLAVVYLLLLHLEGARPSEKQTALLHELAPEIGFDQPWDSLPELPEAIQREASSLGTILGLELDQLCLLARFRLHLGHKPFPKRIRQWSETGRQQEVDALRTRVQQNCTQALHQIWQARQHREPDESERKRCRKALKAALVEMPKTLWAERLEKLNERLLRHLLGDQLASEVPRAARLLSLTAIPLETICRLRESHPANERWLQAFERQGFSAAHWLDGLRAEFRIEGKYIELKTETDPAEVLEMGTHFETCLSLDDGFNAFSALTNCLEVNKMVLLGRDLNHQVVLRKLIGVTLKGELVGYQTYSHLVGTKAAVHEACRRFAHQNGFRLSDTAVPERIFADLEWYDDGPEAWHQETAPPDYPVDWPHDLEGYHQWYSRRLALGQASSDFQVRRAVDIFHRMMHGAGLKKRDRGCEEWRWEDAYDALVCRERYDLVADPRNCLSPSYAFDSLMELGGMDPAQAPKYTELLNPEHRLYRNDRPRPAPYFEPSTLVALAPPKVIAETCQGLASQNFLDPDTPLYRRLAETVYLAFQRSPDDPGWRKFDHPALEKLMVEIGCRVAVAQWLPCFRRLTEGSPDWDKAWLARAMVESERVLPLIQARLARNRRSLYLALALKAAGVEPEDYILPRPATLCSGPFLNVARPLRSLLRSRLARLESKGYSASSIRTTRLLLKDPDPLSWRTWPRTLRDTRLDQELSREVLRERRFDRVGGWVSLGERNARIELLWMLDAGLSAEDKRQLLEIYQPAAQRPREILVANWLANSDPTVSAPPTRQAGLLWLGWPVEALTSLRSQPPDSALQILQSRAEYLRPEELHSLFQAVFAGRTLDHSELEEFLDDEVHAVELQKLVLDRMDRALSVGSLYSQRGAWALKYLATSSFTARSSNGSVEA